MKSMTTHYADARVTVHAGNCLDVLATLPDNSVDSVVTDPPYGLANTTPAQVTAAIARWATGDRAFVPDGGRGFMGKEWDRFVPPVAVWDECLRVLKPGGHALVFAGSRTVDLMTLGLRLAGFDIRDSIAWLYGSGFPKSLDVSKAIDKAAGAEREVVGTQILGGTAASSSAHRGNLAGGTGVGAKRAIDITAPATPDAERWQGWGTALKPGHEPIILARKPFPGTVAANVLEHGTGALNIDACRVAAVDPLVRPAITRRDNDVLGKGLGVGVQTEPSGRWPANVVLDETQAEALDQMSGDQRDGTAVQRNGGGRQIFGGLAGGQNASGPTPDAGYGSGGGASRFFYTAKADSGRWPANVALDETQAEALDQQSGDLTSAKPSTSGRYGEHQDTGRNETYGKGLSSSTPNRPPIGDTGGASRFFYTAKADSNERPRIDGVVHPTVKPLDLMRWLVRLVTPPGGKVLDPFAGSGTTGEAALLEGFQAILIERETDYLPLITQRIHRRIDPVEAIRQAGGDLGLFDLDDDGTPA